MTRLNPAALLFLLLLPFFLWVAAGESKRGLCRLGKAIIAILLFVVFIISSVSLAAQILSRLKFPQEPEPEPAWEPGLLLPFKDVEDVYPQGPGSLLRSFSFMYYNLKETTVKNEKDLQEHILCLLDENREEGVLFLLPEEVAIRGSDTSDEFAIAASLSDYDKQILGAYKKIQQLGRLDYAFQYHRIGVTALNCLDSLSGKCRDGELSYSDEWDNFLYYSELAVWALCNEYILSPDLTGGERVDLFYRLAQAYDHAGTATTDKDPPFKHELFFASAAFLELSFRSLKIISFSGEGHYYRSAVWNLHMTMHLRVGKYVNAHEEFFKMFEDCKKDISELELTSGEQAKIKTLEEDLADWRDLHGTAQD